MIFKQSAHEDNYFSVPSVYVKAWIYLAQDRDNWQVFMNTIMSLGVP
jgi:hypothetical protein